MKRSKRNQLTFFAEEPRVSPSASPDLEADWLMSVETWPLNFAEFWLKNSHVGSGGKTFPVSLVQTGGGDFETIINAFSECGYSVAWRILDAQFFGVPQRRRRIFVIGYLGNDWRPPSAVLFERESLFRNIKTSKETWKDVASTIDASTGRSRGAGTNPGLMTTVGTLDARTKGGGFPGSDGAMNGHVIPYNVSFNDVNGKRKDRPNGGLYVNETQISNILTRATPSDTLLVGSWWDGSQTAQTLDAVLHKGQTMPEKNRFPAVLFHDKASSSQSMNPSEISPSIDTVKQPSVFVPRLKVRRITPMEAERLQGFPDQYTGIKKAKDSPRYKSIGNSMAVPVMKWIAQRMQIVDQIFNK